MASCILRLTVSVPIDDTVIIRADGQEVYRGKDFRVVERWQRYFWDQTPWAEIHKAETVHQ